jgi:cyclohexanecarboxylate-CoA ligase
VWSLRASDEAIREHSESGVWRVWTPVDDLRRWARERPDAPALVAHRAAHPTTRLSYREYEDWAGRFAGAFAELGVGSGDVVSVQLPNWWQVMPLAVACWRMGAVWAPIMTTIRGRELERMLARLRTQVFVTTDSWDGHEHAATVAEMAQRLPELAHRVVLGDVVTDGEIDFVRFFQETDRAVPSAEAADPDRVGLALFTSGSTGEPKAVLRTLNNQFAQMAPGVPELGAGDTAPRTHTPQSAMHSAGTNSYLVALWRGGTALVTDRWDPAVTAGLLARERIEYLWLVPSFLTELLAALRADGSPRLPALREVTAVGAAVSARLVADTAEVLGMPLRTVWGSTEGGGTGTGPDDPDDWAAHSIGRPGPNTEIELRPVVLGETVDEKNPGQVFIRGASVCLATIGRDSGELRVLAKHDDGWYDIGDLAVCDGRGGYRLVGRVADRIGDGFMIPVPDVEDALRAHPDIVDVAVVGHRGGLEGCAVLVATAPVTVRDVRDYLGGLGMTEWYWPTRVERVSALPRNGMGKVEKAQLRARLDEALEDRVATHGQFRDQSKAE